MRSSQIQNTSAWLKATATQSPHLSQIMARWFSFFAEYNFEVKYKLGKQNAFADLLSRRPDYEIAHVTTLSSSVNDLIRTANAKAEKCVALIRALGSEEFEDSDIELSARLCARLHRYSIRDRRLALSFSSI